MVYTPESEKNSNHKCCVSSIFIHLYPERSRLEKKLHSVDKKYGNTVTNYLICAV